MRWVLRKIEVGDTRIIRRFLLLPRKIDGEIRWLEVVRIKQVRRKSYEFFIPDITWHDVEFVNN